MTAGQPEGAPLEQELVDARVDDAAAARRQARWTAARAATSRSLDDVLAATGGAPTRVALDDGSEHRGRVRSVGADAVELTEGTSTTVVALAHVVAVGSEGGPRTGGATTPSGSGGWSLEEVLVDLVDSGRPVRLGLTGPHLVVGEVVAAGRTVTVRTADGTTEVLPGAVVWATFTTG